MRDPDRDEEERKDSEFPPVGQDHPDININHEKSNENTAPDGQQPQDNDNATSDPAVQDAEKGGDSPQQHSALSKDIYSVFTVPEKRAIILAGSFTSWFSPMSGSIYFPALNQIAGDLDVSVAKVNITVTTYLVRYPHSPIPPSLPLEEMLTPTRSSKPSPPC